MCGRPDTLGVPGVAQRPELFQPFNGRSSGPDSTQIEDLGEVADGAGSEFSAAPVPCEVEIEVLGGVDSEIEQACLQPVAIERPNGVVADRCSMSEFTDKDLFHHGLKVGVFRSAAAAAEEPHLASLRREECSRPSTVDCVSVSAVSIPASPLLLPGAAGRADPLGPLRSDALAALHDLANSHDHLVVLASGVRAAIADAQADLGQAGGPWSTCHVPRDSRPTAGIDASVVLSLLGRLSPRRTTTVVEVDREVPGDVVSTMIVGGAGLVVCDDRGHGPVRGWAQRTYGAGTTRQSGTVGTDSFEVIVWEHS